MNYKPSSFPMGLVLSVVENDLGEVTEAVVRKGSSGEHLRRHVNSLILLLQNGEYNCENVTIDERSKPEESVKKPRGKAACEGENRNKRLFSDSLA